MPVNIDAVDQVARDLAQSAYSHGEAHEQLCELRWEQNKASIALVLKTVDEIKRGMDNSIARLPATVIAVLTALVGWLAARAFPM